MRNKPLLIAVALVGLLSVLVFAAGWMFGSLKRPEPAQAGTAASVPVGARAIFVPGDGQIDAIRRGVPVDKEGHPPPMARVENADIRRVRNYPMQPPTIPHTIDGYQVDKEFNRCMFCHARTRTQETGAIPVSITHYQDRNGNMLADVSPRRYFCIQCHVAQADAKPLIGNNFVDVEQLLRRKPGVLGSTK